ncbi:hypothetical protein PQB77_gp27 [Arthrobacter phage Correa]|uniref:Uncharacterized protein n=1 Tax=Arthrobacter phage Correa TaxID=2024275 RepID=A0A222Z6G0_9CAUD|nr:hypothetical protein PQB77_gp27 [Arthrobacter phage Correa]ASR80088.1 hypothetical protein SEA_CORREA_27 [Arthrobacter phage Correa]
MKGEPMSNNQTQEQNASIDDVIAKLLNTLLEHDPTSKEYSDAADQLEKLSKFKATTGPTKLDKNNILSVAGNLAGIVLILGHEYVGPVTSKALSFVMKTKI